MTPNRLLIHRIAAFTYNRAGGNPAGVALLPRQLDGEEMQRSAREVGYAETAFLWPSQEHWKVRYFAPEIEIPFCGHATIASGALLGQTYGAKTFDLTIASGDLVTVDAFQDGDGSWFASLQSPQTFTKAVSDDKIAEACMLFGIEADALDQRLPPRIINAGANHFLLGIRSRERLSTIGFSFEKVRAFQQALGLATVSLVHAETNRVFHTRNPFPIGGLYEDPATGAAAAALAGYLREIGWPLTPNLEIIQGEDIGQTSKILVELCPEQGSSVKVSGSTCQVAEPLTFKVASDTLGVSQ